MNYESSIVNELKKIPNSNGFKRLEILKKIQIEFLVNSINNTIEVNKGFEDVVKSICEITSLSVSQHGTVDIGEGLVVISNHLAINKLTKIHPHDLQQFSEINFFKYDFPMLENNDPFIILLAPIWETVSRMLKSHNDVEIIFVFMRLEQIYTDILLKLNAVIIDRGASNQLGKLITDISNKVILARKENKKPIIIIFPEGGSSGKKNLGGPYSLLEFKEGYKKIAGFFNYSILPIAIKVDQFINYHATIGNFLSEDDVSSDRKSFINLLES